MKRPFFDTLGCHGAPHNALFTLYKLPVSVAPLRMRIFAKIRVIFAQNLRNFHGNILHMHAHVHRARTASSTQCQQKPWWHPHVLPLADSETLSEKMYIVEVTNCPLAGPASQLPHSRGPLSTHGPLGGIPHLSTEAFAQKSREFWQICACAAALQTQATCTV